MSSWGKYDNAANAPYWAVNSAIVNAPLANTLYAAPTADNVALLYANTTANVYTSRETIGLFAVDTQEAAVNGKVAHAGWILKTTGQGGRAGRIQQETLVAFSSVTRDGDQQVYPNVAITLTGPSSTTVVANASFANVASFTVSPSLTGNTAATLTYAWYYNNASGSQGWLAVANSDVANVRTTGMTSATLSIAPKTTANTGSVYRAVVTAAGQGVSATSANATLTVS